MGSYDNVIWVDSGYWALAFFGGGAIVSAFLLVTDRSQSNGPADELALGFCNSIGGFVIVGVGMFIALTVLHWCGVDFGMAG